MLVCLVVIPVVAPFGTSLPNVVASLLDRCQDVPPPTTASLLPEAPPFEPNGTLLAPQLDRPSIDAPPAAPEARGAGGPNDTALPPPAAPASPMNPTAAVGGQPSAAWPPADAIPAGYAAPLPPVRGSGPGLPGPRDPAGEAGLCRSQSASTKSVAPMEPLGAPVAAPAWPDPSASTAIEMLPAPDAPPAGAAQAQQGFAPLLARLRQLGATHYRLESWGADLAMCRFECRVAVGPGTNLVRQFDAVGSDPIRAMTQVLDDIERWRVGQDAARP